MYSRLPLYLPPVPENSSPADWLTDLFRSVRRSHRWKLGRSVFGAIRGGVMGFSCGKIAADECSILAGINLNLSLMGNRKILRCILWRAICFFLLRKAICIFYLRKAICIFSEEQFASFEFQKKQRIGRFATLFQYILVSISVWVWLGKG